MILARLTMATTSVLVVGLGMISSANAIVAEPLPLCFEEKDGMQLMAGSPVGDQEASAILFNFVSLPYGEAIEKPWQVHAGFRVDDCATGQMLIVTGQSLDLSASEDDAFNSVVDGFEKRRSPSLNQISRALGRAGLSVTRFSDDTETCYCNAARPQLVGDKTPYEAQQ